MPIQIPRLYPILDASFLPALERGAYLTRVVRELEDAGVTLLQYRNKQGGVEETMSDAGAMRAAATSQLRLIMNDSPELAVRAGFDGVHVGQEDISPALARSIVGPDGIVGVSTHNRAQLEIAAEQPVDYIAIGPVFATASKKNPDNSQDHLATKADILPSEFKFVKRKRDKITNEAKIVSLDKFREKREEKNKI